MIPCRTPTQIFPSFQIFFFYFFQPIPIKKFAPHLHPFHQMAQFASIKPDPVNLAAINDDTTFGTKVNSVHQLCADRAFNIRNRILVGFPVKIDAVNTNPVYLKNICDHSIQKYFQFYRIEE